MLRHWTPSNIVKEIVGRMGQEKLNLALRTTLFLFTTKQSLSHSHLHQILTKPELKLHQHCFNDHICNCIEIHGVVNINYLSVAIKVEFSCGLS